MSFRICAIGMKGMFLGCVSLIAFTSTACPAYAYVDPGSGMFLLQIVGSVFAGTVFLIRKRIYELLRISNKHRKE